MRRMCVAGVLFALLLAAPLAAYGQQLFRLPDKNQLKHLTTKQSEHAPDIPGKETTMDYYSAPNGDIVTIYSYRGRAVAFSTHSNSDLQNTYRLYMDLTGNGTFQEVGRTQQWQLPPWSKAP